MGFVLFNFASRETEGEERCLVRKVHVQIPNKKGGTRHV